MKPYLKTADGKHPESFIMDKDGKKDPGFCKVLLIGNFKNCHVSFLI